MGGIDDDIDTQLQMFEAAIDKSDPEQMKLLDQMKLHTKRLHQARGDWNNPNNPRLWNDPTPQEQATAPLAIDSYRAYKEHKQKIDKEPMLSILAAPSETINVPRIEQGPS